MNDQTSKAATIEIFRRLEQARSKAIIDADMQTLERMLADDLSYTHSNGLNDDKSAFLTRVKNRVYRRIDARDLTVHAEGALSIVSGIAEIETEANDKRNSFVVRFVNVWIFSGAVWRHALWQSTII